MGTVVYGVDDDECNGFMMIPSAEDMNRASVMGDVCEKAPSQVAHLMGYDKGIKLDGVINYRTGPLTKIQQIVV